MIKKQKHTSGSSTAHVGLQSTPLPHGIPSGGTQTKALISPVSLRSSNWPVLCKPHNDPQCQGPHLAHGRLMLRSVTRLASGC